MPAPATRLPWIDLLRGLAVVGMIATHVFNAFLDPQWQDSAWRQWFWTCSGLVAPVFLWIAGYIQGLSIHRAHALGHPLATPHRWRRLALILAIGYLLHLPGPQWLAGDFGADTWRTFLQVDTLQCLAISLALLLGLGLVGPRGFDPAVALSMLAAVAAAPALDPVRTSAPFLDAYLSHGTGSLFPMFPWYGFCAAGCLGSRWQLSWRLSLPLSAALIVTGWVFRPDLPHPAHPAFFMERLGWVMLLALAVRLLSRWHAPRWLLLTGRESLLVYVAHLLLLFTIPFTGRTLRDAWGDRLPPLASLGLFLAILLLCLGLAGLNERRKRSKVTGSSIVAH